MAPRSNVAALLALLALCSSGCPGVAQAKSAPATHTPLIRLPQGALTTVASPDQKWKLIFEFQSVYETRKLWIQPKGSNRRTLVREFQRSLDISWSPDSRHFFVNDRSASGETRPYIYEPASLQAIDLAELVGKASPKAADYLGSDHSYLEATRWINSQEVILKLTSYFSEPPPQRPGFSGTYRVNLGGTVRRLKEQYWR